MENRSLAALDHVFGPPHHRGGVAGNHPADDQPVEQHPHSVAALDLPMQAWQLLGGP